jgi:hypothetical protein
MKRIHTGRRNTGLGLLILAIGLICLFGRTRRKHGADVLNTPWEQYSRKQINDWLSNVFVRTMTTYRDIEQERSKLSEPIGHRRFDLLSPFLGCPDGAKPTRFGSAHDGGKLICQNLLSAPDCVIYSLGSRNDYAFEEDIIARTKCTLVTFDCTVDGRNIHARHIFRKFCLGSKAKMEASPSNWTTLSGAMETLGHTRLDLLKIDIEGAEYDVMGEWRQDDRNLPRQIAMELHYSGIYYGTPSFRNPRDMTNLLWPLHDMRLTDLSLFVSHLVGAGYGIVSREDNARAHHCSELTLVRVLSGANARI